MKLASKNAFLKVEALESPNLFSVEITTSLKAVLRSWQSTTRISPLFPLEGSGVPRTVPTFKGKTYFVFVGPLEPEKTRDWKLIEARLWVTFGLFNVLVHLTAATEKNRVVHWAKQNGLACEIWTLSNRTVQDIEVIAAREDGQSHSFPWRADLAKLLNANFGAQLNDTIKDYCPLIATTLSRVDLLPSDLVTDLLETHTYVIETLDDFEQAKGNPSPYPTLGELLTVLAGLSRFNSQTFGGSGRISDWECHLRAHSLFGLGVPNIALARLRKFLEMTLADLPDRVIALSSVTKNVPNLLAIEEDDPFWKKDHLATVEKPFESSLVDVPLLSYFSARDGFKSSQTTISAPINTISGCNSVQWSLLTFTHEYSHVLIRTILSELSPDFESEESVNYALDLLKGRHKPKNLLEEMQRVFLRSLLLIDLDALPKHEKLELSGESLEAIFDQHYGESQEILVHVFDFMYFYGSDLDKYITAIWSSWGTIPNINNRIRDYVVRTICTALVNHVRRTNAEEMARDHVLRSLRELLKPPSSDSGKYVRRAIEYIQTHWEDEIFDRVFVRRDLVKMARGIFFSEFFASEVRRETEQKPGEEGYGLKPGYFESKKIRNPINFLELYTKGSTPLNWYSAWIFYILAFQIKDDDVN